MREEGGEDVRENLSCGVGFTEPRALRTYEGLQKIFGMRNIEGKARSL